MTTLYSYVHLKPEDQFRLLCLYNSHFTGSSSWLFSSDAVQQLFSSWNVNVKCIWDLPFATHRYLLQEITNGKHAKKMVYSRYAKFLKSVSNNRRPMLRGLLNEMKDNCQSVVGQNIRTVLLDTKVKIVPGETNPSAFKLYQVYDTPAGTLLPKNLSSSQPGANLIHFDFMLKPRPFLSRIWSKSGVSLIL